MGFLLILLSAHLFSHSDLFDLLIEPFKSIVVTSALKIYAAVRGRPGERFAATIRPSSNISPPQTPQGS